MGLPLDVPVVLARDEAARLAARELAKAKYGGTPDWLVALLRRLLGLLDRIASSVAGIGDGSSHASFNSGTLVALVVLLAAVGVVVWRVGLPRWRARTRDAQLELEPTAGAADYRALAERAAAAGDWHAAVRDRFRGLVRDLENHTILDPRPARTAWEAAAGAGRLLPGVRTDLDWGADTFNQVLYGERAADADVYAAMAGVDDRVIAAVDRVDLTADEPEPAAR